MLNKINKTECLVALGLCLILAIVMKVSYSSRLADEKSKHISREPFLPVMGTMHTYDEYEEIEYRDSDDDGHYTKRRTIKYNITYSYVVNDTIYYMTVYDKTSLDSTITLYYNPSNPQQTSFFATYEDAVEGFKVVKIIGDVFVILSVLLGCFTVYRTFIYKTPDELGGVVVKDDFTSFDKGGEYDDFKQEEILSDYGVVATDNFDYISTVKRPNMVIPDQGDKLDVDKVETIPFPEKISSKEKVVLYTEDEYEDMINNKM
ncbi:MAG: hypothetical protein IJP29_07720 [Lachnospiraceae bacterium]|nr:hypothetical protein [Lachnospiraceae bacterium]